MAVCTKPGQKEGDKDCRWTSRCCGIVPVLNLYQEPCAGLPSGTARLDRVEFFLDSPLLLLANIAPTHCVKIYRPWEYQNRSVLVEDNKIATALHAYRECLKKELFPCHCRVLYGQIFGETDKADQNPALRSLAKRQKESASRRVRRQPDQTWRLAFSEEERAAPPTLLRPHCLRKPGGEPLPATRSNAVPRRSVRCSTCDKPRLPLGVAL